MKSVAVKKLTFVIILTLIAAFGVSGCDSSKDEPPAETLTIDEPPAQVVPTPEPGPAQVVEVPTPPECTINENCNDVSKVCTEGKCVTPEPPPVTKECTTNADCSDGRVCADEKCVAVEPPTPEPEPEPQLECTTNADCGADKVCTEEKCVVAAKRPPSGSPPPPPANTIIVAQDGSGDFKTIQAAANAAKPGDTILVKKGTYADSDSNGFVVITTKGGTQDNWVTFRSEEKWGAIIDGENNKTNYCWGLEADYVRIEDFDIRGCANGGFWSNTPGTKYNYFYGNNVHHIGNICTDTNYGGVGIYQGKGTSYHVYDSNVWHHIGRLHNCVKPDGTKGNGDWRDHALYLAGDEVKVINNIFYENTSGWNIDVCAWVNISNYEIINNTFVGGKASDYHYVYGLINIDTANDKTKITNVEVLNNIFYAPPPNGAGIELYPSSANKFHITIKNNIFHGVNYEVVQFDKLKTFLNPPDAINYTLEDNFLNTDPLLLDLPKLDFSLSHNSPAIDRGTDVSVFCDFNGNIRPSGNAVDIGAFEDCGDGKVCVKGTSCVAVEPPPPAQNVKTVDVQNPKASDENPGTPELPWKSIAHAAKEAKAGDKVLVKPGIYREKIEVFNSGTAEAYITFEAEDGVVVTGADQIKPTSWVSMPNGVYRADGWTYQFSADDLKLIEDAKKLFKEALSKGLPAELPITEWVDKDFNERRVFVDGKPLTQVFSQADIKGGTFFIDKNNILYLSLSDALDPKDHLIEASLRPQVLIANGKDFINIKGFQFRAAANNPRLNSIHLNGKSINFENNVISNMAAGGMAIEGSDLNISGNTILDNGHVGVGSYGSKTVTFSDNTVTNNSIKWKNIIKAEPKAAIWENGGVKLASVNNWKISGLKATHNVGAGLWIDVGNSNEITGGGFFNNSADGVNLEHSHNSTVSFNSFSGNGYGGITCNANNCSVHHNVFYNNKSGFGLLLVEPVCFTGEQYCNTDYNKSSVAKVYNNTFNESFECIKAYTPLKSEIKNNIFTGTCTGVALRHAATSSVSTIEYNDFWGMGTKILWYDPKNPSVGIVIKPPISNIYKDPKFVDAAGGDFKLSAGSPCINAGTDVGLPYKGTAPDMGAVEGEAL